VKPLDLWSPPENAGDPVGCLATTFTFAEDFFSTDCLARFLGLTASFGEGDTASDISLMVEEEERLAETPVVVLVDRSHIPEPRNLRWDLLHVSVPGGLLHAKTAVLVWERALRLVIGSANLTAAGYRRQVELVAAFELTETSADLPRPMAEGLLDEIRLIASEVPPEVGGARDRALSILDIASDRLASASHIPQALRGVELAVAPVRPGRQALEGFRRVWRGPDPRSGRAMSPFWDSEPGGASANGVAAVAQLLSTRRRSNRRPSLGLLVNVEVAEGGRIVRAPATILDSVPETVDAQTLKFTPDEEGRRLHAKWLQFENDDWVAVMFGSSNLTAKGLGLAGSSHRELNLWIGTRRDTPIGKRLRSMVSDDGRISGEVAHEPDTDEDEVDTIPLPHGFVAAVLHGTPPAAELHLHLDPERLPTSWTVAVPGSGDAVLISSDSHSPASRTRVVGLTGTESAPGVLDVRWVDSTGAHQTAWAVNVHDPSDLPPPAELRDLPVDHLLKVLASTRPLREAIESEYRAHLKRSNHDDIGVLDPLKKHQLTTALLPRVRQHSAALFGIQNRLERPVSSLEALGWRLTGTMGPTYLAERLTEEADGTDGWLPGEAQFLLAELALTVRRAKWDIREPVTTDDVQRAVDECLRTIDACASRVGGAERIPQLQAYIDAARAEATR
jgi:hypothetical protein